MQTIPRVSACSRMETTAPKGRRAYNVIILPRHCAGRRAPQGVSERALGVGHLADDPDTRTKLSTEKSHRTRSGRILVSMTQYTCIIFHSVIYFMCQEGGQDGAFPPWTWNIMYYIENLIIYYSLSEYFINSLTKYKYMDLKI